MPWRKTRIRVLVFLTVVSSCRSATSTILTKAGQFDTTSYASSYPLPESNHQKQLFFSKKQFLRNLTSQPSEIYDFHVPKFPRVNTSSLLTCGYRESRVAHVHELQWLKDDIVFFSYHPTGSGSRIAHVFPDSDWLHHNSVTHMVDTVNVRGEVRHNQGYNITVVSLRIRSVSESMSGVYKCKLSVSMTHMMDGAIAFIKSREGRLTVVSHDEEWGFPEILVDKRVRGVGVHAPTYRPGQLIRLICQVTGSPAPPIEWSYVRSVKKTEDEEEDEMVDLYTGVGRSRLEKYAITVNADGVETRRLGMTIQCCRERRLLCSLDSQDDSVTKGSIVQILDQAGVWKVHVIKASDLNSQDYTDEVEEEEEQEEEEGANAQDLEDQSWLIWDEATILGVSIAGGVVLILIVGVCSCCCISHKNRRARKKKNKEIRRRQIYGNSLERGRSKSLGRRSTKRKAPVPAFSMEEKLLTTTSK